MRALVSIVFLALVSLASATATCTAEEAQAYQTHCTMLSTLSYNTSAQDIVCDATTACGTALATIRTNCPESMQSILSAVDTVCTCTPLMRTYETACPLLGGSNPTPLQILDACSSAAACNQAITALAANAACSPGQQWSETAPASMNAACSFASDPCTLATYTVGAHCPDEQGRFNGLTASNTPDYCGTNECNTALNAAAAACTAPVSDPRVSVTQASIDEINSITSHCTTYSTCITGGGTNATCYAQMMSGGGAPVGIIIGVVVAVAAIAVAVVVYLKMFKAKANKKDMMQGVAEIEAGGSAP